MGRFSRNTAFAVVNAPAPGCPGCAAPRQAAPRAAGLLCISSAAHPSPNLAAAGAGGSSAPRQARHLTAGAAAAAVAICRGARSGRLPRLGRRYCHSRTPRRAAEEKSSAIALKPTFDFPFWAEHVDEVQRNADDRKFPCDVKQVVDLYHEMRESQQAVKETQTKRNANAKLMKGKLEPDVRQQRIEEGKQLKEEVARLQERADELGEKLLRLAWPIPNISHPDVPVGAEESAVVLRINGTPRTSETAGFQIKDHLEIGRALDLFDFESGGKVSGQKFLYFRRGAALLELALTQWAMHEAVKAGFTPLCTPDLVREQVVAGCGFMPRDGEATQIYSVADSDLCLAGTAEIPLAGIFMNETLIASKELPKKFAAYGHAFRTEAGSTGSENRGIYRLHQFSKVELFAVTRGGSTEESDKMLEEIRSFEENIFEQLGLCFRVLDMPTEELGAPAYRKYDMEAWMPGMEKWGEISSCSNCTDYQARRLNIRHKEIITQKGNLDFAHTLNGTACAVPRMIISILETYQNEDGTVTVPEVLRPYMMGMDVLRPE